MATFYTTYREAHTEAVKLARLLGRETGIEKFKEYGTQSGFLVHHLPKPENRYGFELRCEVVAPGDPI